MFLMWLAAALAPGVDAASLFKCVGADGGVSYQSSACEAGAKLVWERPVEAGPAPASSAAEGSAEAAEPVVPKGRPVLRRVGAAPRASAPRKSDFAACQRAHAADAAYRAQPLSRVKHDGLRRHGDRIRAACGSG
jgi:hypothetical protein